MAAAEVIPEEIVIKILLRLPARSLVRFRSVCKSWNALITKSHAFIASHLQLHKNDVSFLIERHEKDSDSICHVGDGNRSRGRYYELSNPKIPLTKYLRNQLIDSCNGVMCIQRDNDILLCNPYINELVTLRPPHNNNIDTWGLVGFGHNPLSGYFNDFKVLHFYYVRDHAYPLQLEIYTTLLNDNNNNNSWRQIESRVLPLRLCKVPYLGKQVIYKEFICWCPFEDSLLLFDVVKEEFSEMELPHCLQYHNNNINNNNEIKRKQIALLDGCLSPITFEGSYGTNIIEKSVQVWVLKEKKKKIWTKLYDTNLLGSCQLLGFVKGGCILFRYLEGLVFYNSRTGMLELHRAPPHIGDGGCRDYNESLVSILLPKAVEQDHYLNGFGDLSVIT